MKESSAFGKKPSAQAFEVGQTNLGVQNLVKESVQGQKPRIYLQTNKNIGQKPSFTASLKEELRKKDMQLSLDNFPDEKDESVSYNSELEESTDKLVHRQGNFDNFEDIQLTLNKSASNSNIFFKERQKIPAYGNLTPNYELKGEDFAKR